MITGNKGEWSEVYALFKLLGDQQLLLGDKDLNKLENLVYPIIKIIRSQSTGVIEYSIDDKIKVISEGEVLLEVSVTTFKEKASYLIDQIRNSKERTFSIPIIEEFMKTINCLSLKASSSSKTDITLIVHDQRTNQQPTLGFSIKSQLGNPSTLLNAGKTTNFIYRIDGVKLSTDEINSINTISSRSKIKDRINYIVEKGGEFVFVRPEKQIFTNNLILIDSLLPNIIAACIFKFYTSEASRITDLVSYVAKNNPLNYDMDNMHRYYDYKVKRFLTEVACGLMPSAVWYGQHDVTGGYLIIKEDGEILCYHIYDRNQFEAYLFNNTKLDTASTSRHEFGELYQEEDQLFFKLNLQIRFLK